ncbi:flagellar biosynthesis anti-sigma factor FlgM [Enterobacter sp.]|uniref:flagellar biosynthesis anti-sigma factor FlgM n=1 Tax=Enterobacter sp. TaxID=42895 RepID=UPI00296FA783|nr:flagellar biosynthesis anti-sigma factor FlgM [Enterobacter sp.]
MAITNESGRKITQLPLASRPTTTSSQKKSADAAAQTIATLPGAEDITQQGLHTAQSSLDGDDSENVDTTRVAEMQALLASDDFTVDTDALAASMLAFFQS